MPLTPEHAAARKHGIGGSELGSILHKQIAESGDTVYGCPRALFYDKTGVPPDYEFDESGPIKRGEIMEPYIADLYSEETGRKVRRLEHKVGKEKPWEMVSIDRQIIGDKELGVGILECKSVGREVWWKIVKGGLPLRFILQVQWAFHVLGPQYEWGDAAVLCCDPWAYIFHRVERDQQLINMMAKLVADFWKRVQNNDVPPRLKWSDTRCKNCLWRSSCQGKELMKAADIDEETFGDAYIDDALGEVVALRMEMKGIIDEATSNKTDAEDTLKDAMTAAKSDIVIAGGHKVTWYQQDDGEIVDGKRLKKEEPETFKKFSKVKKGSRPMNFKPI